MRTNSPLKNMGQGLMDFFGIVRDVVLYGIPGLFRLAFAQVIPAFKWWRRGVELQDKTSGRTWVSHNPLDMFAYTKDGLRTGMKMPSELSWNITMSDRNSWFWDLDR